MNTDVNREAFNRDHLAVVLMNVVAMNQLDIKTLDLIYSTVEQLDCTSELKDVVFRTISISRERALQAQQNAAEAISEVESKLHMSK